MFIFFCPMAIFRISDLCFSSKFCIVVSGCVCFVVVYVCMGWDGMDSLFFSRQRGKGTQKERKKDPNKTVGEGCKYVMDGCL
mmetsp:Transcript_27737/g.66907  ORF Transcript_27737/g.66907 Transcript_27737/m.66907 type:complete len:82 (-) Transcript_27737:30-275(-)